MSKKKSILLTFVLLMVGGLTTFATAAPNGEAGNVAKIGNTEYATLADAINVVQEGETITMIADVEKAAGISVPSGKNFTVDFKNYKYAVECPGAGSAGTQTQAFQLLQGSTIVFKNGRIECTTDNKNKTWSSSDASKGIAFMIQNYANLTLENMTIDGTNIAHNGNPGTVRYIISNNSGNVNFTGATNIIAPDGDYAFDVCKYALYDAPTVTWNSTGSVIGKIELTGGEFVVAQNLALTQPIRTKKAAAKLTVNANITPASGETSWNGGDALVIVNRTGNLSISGSGTITCKDKSEVMCAVKMTEKTVDEADAIKDEVAKLTVDGSVTLIGYNYGISGNGNRQGTEITINGGTIKGVATNDCVGIYHPQSGTLTINGGTVEGATGIYVKSGSVTTSVNAGTIKGIGAKGDYVTAGKFTNTGDAFALENCNYPGGAPNASINGGTFISTNGSAVASYAQKGYEPITGFINGGTFSDEGAIKYAAENAKITVKLGAHRTAGTGVFVKADQNQTITFDLNGKTFSANGPAVGSNGTQTQAFHLEKGNTITIKNGTIECTEANKGKTWSSSDASKGIAFMIQNYANLTLENMTIDGTNIAHNGNPGTVRYIISNNSGNVNFTGVTNIIAPDGDYAFDVCKYASYDAPTVTWNSEGSVIGKIELTGGEFVVAQNLALTQPIRTKKAAAKLTVNANITPASGETSWNGGDALVIVNRTGDLTISGSGTISGNQTVSAAVKMTEKTVDEADAIKDNVAKLTVDGSVTLEGDYFGITGNGSRHGTEITVKGGTIKGVHANDNLGIFHPQDGKLTITGGTIEGYSSAVEVRAGTVNISGGSLESTAATFSCSKNGSGNTTVGAALAIAQHTTKKDISVEISGGSFTGVKALNESNPQQNDPAPQVTMNVSGGKFKGEISAEDVKNFLSGGIYSLEPDAKYVANGKVVIDNPDATTKSDYPFAVEDAPVIRYYLANNDEKTGTFNDFTTAVGSYPNAIAIVSSEYSKLAAAQNNVLIEYDNGGVKNYVCPKFVLKDLEDFYSPVDFKALEGSYTRIADNVKSMNSVCLPFAITTENVNNGKIGTYKSSNITNGTGTISFEEVNSIGAGVPCIVECTDDVAWQITFDDTAIKATPDDTDNNPIKGAYIKKELGAGFFKVSSDGTNFVNTVYGKSHAWPFRAYLDIKGESAKELTIEWNDGSTTGINTIDNGQLTKDNSKAYNLNGVRVNSNYKGIVIINGKKYIK